MKKRAFVEIEFRWKIWFFEVINKDFRKRVYIEEFE